MKMPGRQVRTGLSLLFVLVVAWVLLQVVFKQESIYRQMDQFVFIEKSASIIKQKIQTEIDRFRNSDSPTAQTAAIVHIIECSQFLMYEKKLKVEHYYDYMRMMTFPVQRKQLKDKAKYIEDTKRYLRRKRNLYLKYHSYSLSTPQFPTGSRAHSLEAEVYVLRKSDKGDDYIRYNFRKHKDNRYYLLLDKSRGGIPFRLEERTDG
jgi:hypothetical protein